MLTLPKQITRTLSARLSLFVVCVIALLLSMSLAVVFHYSRKSIRKEALENAAQTLDGTVQHIDNILFSVEQATGNVYWELLMHLDEPDRMLTYSRSLVECNPFIAGCAIVFKPYYYPDRELFMAYVHRKNSDPKEASATELITSQTFANRSYTKQVWYTIPMTTGRSGWTDPLKGDDTEDEAIITFCLPIFDGNKECVGVIATDVSIEVLSQIVLSAKPSPHSYSVMLDHNGSFIVHPDTVKLKHQTVFIQTELGADPTVREAAEAMVAGETGYKLFRQNGQNSYVFYKPFHHLEMPGRITEKLGWSVGIVYPEDDIFSEYNQLLYSVLAIAVTGLLLLFWLCLYFTHRQLLPLRWLTHSAQRIADGNYGETIPDTQREDEIGELQDHFQQMQKSLNIHISELELLTATLQERGNQLHEAYHQAQKANHMKTAFLHNMTNQMIEPARTILASVLTFCNNYHTLSRQEADREADTIRDKGEAITNLLDHMLDAADNETGKEGAHE